MKFARWLLIFLGLVVVLAGLLCGLALLPGVQRWAVLRATAGVPGLKFEVARVSAGFSGVVLQDVAFEKRRVAVKVQRLEADFSLAAFLFSQRLEISRLAVTGLDVDASHLSGADAGATAGAPAATPGVLANAELPFDLALDNVRVEGRALVAAAAHQPPVAARFVLTGGKIAPGHEGLLQLDATIDNPAPGRGVTTLRVQAGLRATLTAQRTFSKISLATVVDATGPGISGENQLKLGADLFHSSTGENYEVTVDTALKGTRENVLKFSARLPAGALEYAGNWDLKMSTAQVEPFLLGVMLPDFDLRGGGKFAFAASGAAFSVQGGVRGELNRLEAIDPAWRTFGPVKVDATFDGGQQEGVLQLTQLKMSVARDTPLLVAETTTPIRYDARKHQLLAAAGTGSDPLLRVVLTGVPVDWIRPFAAGLDISGGAITGEFDLAPGAGAATAVAVRARLQAAELTVTQDGRPLLTRGTVFVRTEANLSESALDVPVLELGVSTSDGDALKVSGKLSRSLTPNPPLTFAGNFSASTKRLLESWLPGAPVTAQGEVGLTLRDSVIDLQPGRVQLQQAGKTLFDAAILQPFGFNLNTHALTPRDATQPVMKLTLGRLPLALLPVTDPNAILGGFVEQGEFEVAVRGDKTLVRSLGPLRLGSVSLTQDRRLALTGLAIEAAPQIEYAGADGFRVQSGDVTVRTAGKGTLLTFKAEATATPGQGTQATATFALEAPALATQPLFAGAQALSAGRATGEIRAALDKTQQFEARVTLNGLVAADTNLILPVANIGFRAVTQPNGAMSIQVPILLDNAGRRSDLNFALALSPLAKGFSVDGKISGQQLDWEDTQSLLGAFLASAAPESEDRPVAAPASVTPDTVAAWARFSGQVVLDLKSVTRGKEWAMTGLNGILAIEPARLALPQLTAAFGETSRLNAKMELRFTGGPMPYRLTGDYALNDFDMGKLFKAFDPAKPPTLEGLFNVNSTFTGNGETVQRAIDRVNGEFQLTSHQGIFRGLQRSTNKLSMTSKAVESVASLLGSIINSEKATKAAEKVAGQAYFVDQLAQSLGELRYDQFSVKLTRDELLDMNLQDISLITPELRLTGRAEVTYAAGKPLLDQPLKASLDLAARGKIEEQLGKLRLLSGTKDDLGYAKAKETLFLAGTLGRPDPTVFFTRIATAKVSDLLGE